jgi:tetratricopeptide (TPR) repeat protein
LTLATELDPGNGAIFHELGELNSEIRNDKDAIQNFMKAIEINFETPGLYDDLGAACFRENQFIQAEKYWMESLRINPDNPTVYYNLEGIVRGSDPLFPKGHRM